MNSQESPLPLDQVWDERYRIVSGGVNRDIGTEYKAYDIDQDRLVVVLLLDPYWSRGAAQQRLNTANRRIAELDQPSLISYQHIGAWQGQLYLVRQHREGQMLAELLARRHALELSIALDFAIQICDALALAHQAGIVHGGLSPHSVWVDEEDEIVLLDTGLILALRSEDIPLDQPWGRFPHITPEQAGGEDVSARSDVYATGALFYQMLTGRPPFVARDEMLLVVQHLRQEPPPLSALAPDVPASVVQIVHKALSKEPSARYRNARQLAYILRAQAEALPPSVPQPVPVYVPPEPSPPPLIVPPPQVVYPNWVLDDRDSQSWNDESEGVDWILVGLAVVALIAVLGLIPLWRTVYSRYSAPVPDSAGSYRIPRDALAGMGSLCESRDELSQAVIHPWSKSIAGSEKVAMAGIKLVDSPYVWYNLSCKDPEKLGFGVQLTGAGWTL
ncbi:MAG: serine/threonine-protein kinase [Anaerolineae bacterium]|jgi:serine/threonine-protein kinase